MVHISNGCNSINFEDRITKLSHFDVLKSGPNQAPLVFFDKVKGFLARAPRSQIRGRKVISPKRACS
jgi:hypothetical protein